MRIYGLFALGSDKRGVKTELPDGKYKKLLTDNTVHISGGYVHNEDELPFITVLDG